MPTRMLYTSGCMLPPGEQQPDLVVSLCCSRRGSVAQESAGVMTPAAATVGRRRPGVRAAVAPGEPSHRSDGCSRHSSGGQQHQLLQPPEAVGCFLSVAAALWEHHTV